MPHRTLLSPGLPPEPRPCLLPNPGGAIIRADHGARSLDETQLLLAAALMAVGACLGPTAVVCFGLADQLAPAGTAVEAITVLTAASLGAFAVGTACAGLVVDRSGPGAGFLAATASGISLLGLMAVRRETLTQAP